MSTFALYLIALMLFGIFVALVAIVGVLSRLGKEAAEAERCVFRDQTALMAREEKSDGR